jgi:hypothetical protein
VGLALTCNIVLIAHCHSLSSVATLARPSIIRVNQPGAAGVAARATAGVPEDVCYYEDNYKVRSDPLAMHVHLTRFMLARHPL